VKSETLFNQMAGTGILLSCGAIVPSYSTLRQQLVIQLNQLQSLLVTESHPRTESGVLCHLLGQYLDRYLRKAWQPQGSLAADAPLTTQLQAIDAEQIPRGLAVQLQMLADCRDQTLFAFGYTLISLLSLTDIRQDADIGRLLADYQQRRVTLSLTTLPFADGHNHRHPPTATENRSVCLIAGPCAGNWFSQYETTRSKQGVLWMTAPDPHQFIQRYRELTEQHLPEPLYCVIPLLGDMYSHNDLLAAECQRWAQILAAVSGLAPLRCQLVIYSPLSQQRQRHDPDAAFWVKSAGQTPDNHSLAQQLHGLSQHLLADECGGDLYAVQRRLSATILLEWLHSSPLYTALQSLFTDTPLMLSGVMLADYGQGFTRHGAWSTWLSEHYHLCPALANTLTPPPLPELPVSSPAANVPDPQVVPPTSADYRRHHRLAVLLPLLIIGGIYAGITVFKPLAPPPPFSPRMLASSPGRYLTRHDFAPWFAPGSSTLLPERYQTLAALIPTLQQSARYPVLIVGYADNTGNSDSNRRLSLRRAQGVRDWLVSNSGLPESHFILDSAGESRPLVSDNSTAGQASNRRIEIISLFPQTFKVNKDYD